MLQHVPVAWENAHPVIDTNDVEGLPDRLFRTYFGGQTAYAALLACDKLGLNPNQLLLRSRRCFLKAAQEGLINLSIEGRRPGLDEESQATIRYIIHERKRQMLFVQLFSVRRALVETGTIGPLWQQRQRLVTGREAPPLQPPPLPAPPLLVTSSSSPSKQQQLNSSTTGDSSSVNQVSNVSLGRKNMLSANNNQRKSSTASTNSPMAKKNSNNTRPKSIDFTGADDSTTSDTNTTPLIEEVGWEDQLMKLGRTGSIHSGALTPMASGALAPTSKSSSRKQSLSHREDKNSTPPTATPTAFTNPDSGGLIDVHNLSGNLSSQQSQSMSSPANKLPAPPLPQPKKKIEHIKFPPVPEPAPLFRWRTPETLEKEEQFLSETCGKLVHFANIFLNAEQSRLHEQLTAQQEELEERLKKREEDRKTIKERMKMSSASAIGTFDESSFLTNPALMGFAQTNNNNKSGATSPSTTRPATVDTTRTSAHKAGGSPHSDFDTDSGSDFDDDDDDDPKRMFSRPSTVGGQSTISKVPSSYLWTLGESPYSVAGTRPPRPPTQRQMLVTKYGKVIGDDYVSKTVSRHLKVIAKKAARQISDVVQLNAKDDEIRGEMERFHQERKSTRTKIVGPHIGRGFDSAHELTEAEQRKMLLEYQAEMKAQEQIDKLRNRHEKQEQRKYEIDDRKLTTRAIQREVELVRRENVKSNRERVDNLSEARKLILQVSREGRQERVDLLHQQHRAAAWNSRVSHEMEAMIRAQVRDKVKSMQLTRRWELGELPSADELAEIFHSEMVIQSWNSGMEEGIAPLRQRAQEEQEKMEREERLLEEKQRQQEMAMLEKSGAGSLQSGLNNASVVGASMTAGGGTNTTTLPKIGNNHSNNTSNANFESAGSFTSSARGGGGKTNVLPPRPPSGAQQQSQQQPQSSSIRKNSSGSSSFRQREEVAWGK